jgi:phosphoheptose isomerase
LALKSIDNENLDRAYSCLKNAYIKRQEVFVCGNGGSLTMSDHFHCDHAKGSYYDAKLKPKIQPLTSGSIITAIANDIGYDHIFSFQLEMKANKDDVLVAISASGNSPNIVYALKTAKKIGMQTIAFVGFDGGKAKELSDISLHIKENNYGIIEDAHQSLMHIIAQHIRIQFNKTDKIKL